MPYGKKKAALKELRDAKTNDNGDEINISQDVLNGLNGENESKISFISGGQLFENSSTGTIGTVALEGALPTTTYAFVKPDGTVANTLAITSGASSIDLAIDSTSGEITYNASSGFNYEELVLNSESLFKTLMIQAVSGTEIVRERVAFSLEDVDEQAQIGVRNIDQFSVTGDIEGVLDTNNVSNPKINLTEIKFNDDGAGTSSTLKVGVSIQEVHDVAEDGDDVELIGQTNGPSVVIGDENDNLFKVEEDGFKFIDGGDGYDTITLQQSGGVYDFTSMDSNLVGESTDLRSIEKILFDNNNQKLELNIQDIKRLLKTSEDGILIIDESDSFTNAGGEDTDFVIKEGGSAVQLISSNGIAGEFSEEGTVTVEGETYYKFSHSYGDLLIGAGIDGAADGGDGL